jgi:hypothetical protein
MKNKGCLTVAALLVLIPVGLYLAFQWHLYQKGGLPKSWHQRLTVEVEKPESAVSGSSVGIVRKALNHYIPGRGTVAVSSFRGEAAFVEVAPGQYLFALISGADDWARHVFAEEIGLAGRKARTSEYDAWTQALADLRKEKAFPPERYPLLVTFEDINDPASVKRVDPDDLAAMFGPGHRLKAVTLEITDDPVTEGKIEKVLGWIHTAKYIIPPEQQPKFSKDKSIEQHVVPSDFIDWQTLKKYRDKRM